MTGRGIDQILPHPCDPHICEPYMKSALGYVRLAENANGPLPRRVPFDYIWGDALDELERRGPDARIINLETSVTSRGTCTDKGISYRMNPKNVPCLTAAKVDCCVLSNNHVLDWRQTGFADTLATLRQANLLTAGAGETAEAARKPAIIEVPGKSRILVFAFGMRSSGIPKGWAAAADRPGVNYLPDLSPSRVESVAAQIAEFRRPGDVVVVSIHWGGNWGYEIPAAQRRFAHGLIDDAGADVVHGHSSHHAKGIEIYRNRPIFYGCGDFLNDYEGISGYERYRDDLVGMYFLTVSVRSGELSACDIVPLQIRNFRLNRVSESDRDWLLATLGREGRPFGTSLTPSDDGSLKLHWA